MAIDDATHDHFMQLFLDNSSEEFEQALRVLGMYREDDKYPGRRRLSLTRMRTLLSELSSVLVLEKPIYGRRVIGLCRRFWPTAG